ncbi:class I SAM-dependent rRNA methyltransferase [Enterococcus songbeiensis]
MKIKVTEQAKKKIRAGNPLIQKEDLLQELTETGWVDFIDNKENFLAKGYLGKQNKGIGWVLCREERAIDNDFFVSLFRIAREKRIFFENQEGTTAYRIFNGEGDGLGGVTIERYESFAVFSWYNETLYEKQAELMTAFQHVYPDIQGIYEKIRFETATLPESRFVTGSQAPEPLLVQENFVTFATYLNEGLMAGIFLDQKDVRGRFVGGLASGKKVLNMFSYTGAFSVAALMGGASHTTSVDLAKRSLAKTQEQFAVNGIDPQTQTIHVMDVFSYFKYARKKDLQFDVIVLDPPSFARNKKKVFNVAKNYGELIEDSLPILTKGGLLIASTNAANLSEKKFKHMIETVFAEKDVSYQLVDTYRLPADFVVAPQFQEGNYLKVFFYQVN